MSWEKDIKELKKREKLAEKMGGKEKLQRQKDNKRLNVRAVSYTHLTLPTILLV